MRVAIQPDDYGGRNTPRHDSSSPRWAATLERAGHEVLWVDVCANDLLSRLDGCDGFMWRHGHLSWMRQIARRILPVIEHELGLAVYPDQQTCWHYDDKLAQKYLLEAAGVPTPRTRVFWRGGEPIDQWLSSVTFPVVAKLSSGAGSSNVRLLRDAQQARQLAERLMNEGMFSLDEEHTTRPDGHFWDYHRDYVLLQEFLPANAFDTRVTVIGGRAFAFRRLNRPDDFRASGSGLIDHDPGAIDPAAVRLALDAAHRLGAQSLAFDILRAGDQPVVVETSYTYTSWTVHACPGHWTLAPRGENRPAFDRRCIPRGGVAPPSNTPGILGRHALPGGRLACLGATADFHHGPLADDPGVHAAGEPRRLVWHDGHTWPEEAQAYDFLARLERRSTEVAA